MSYNCVPSSYPSGVYTSILTKDNGAKSAGVALQLPLPSVLPYESTFDWSSEEVNQITSLLVKSSEGSNATTNADSAKIVGNMRESLSNMGRWAGEKAGYQIFKRLVESAASKTGINVGEADIKYLTKVAAGVAYNPNKQLLFNGIPHREFTLSFDIVPQNAQQAQAAAAGIQALRIAASPSYTQGQVFFTYPSTFSCTVYVNGVVIVQRPSFSIRSINTNLTPNGVMSWHGDGKPTSFTLEISCIETNVTTAEAEAERVFLGEGGSTGNADTGNTNTNPTTTPTTPTTTPTT